MVNAFPLDWPPGRGRTKNRERSRFSEKTPSSFGYRPVSHTKALSTLQTELDRLKATNIVLSTNLQLRFDGLPRAGQNKLEDPGVAIYFMLFGEKLSMACDKYDRVEDNMYAIGKTIEAIRAIERWGSKDMMKAAFTGFKALPAPDQIVPMSPQYFNEVVNKDHLRSTYKRIAKELHPDMGGDQKEFSEMQRQYDVAKSRFE